MIRIVEPPAKLEFRPQSVLGVSQSLGPLESCPPHNLGLRGYLYKLLKASLFYDCVLHKCLHSKTKCSRNINRFITESPHLRFYIMAISSLWTRRNALSQHTLRLHLERAGRFNKSKSVNGSK
ncbi:hypothetical protein TNCV_2889641 [Trichonephila clavipes]|nr:hypothetical protein TNCV_2889641 [Trichonephila clavipes]